MGILLLLIMAIPKNKRELIFAIETNYGKFKADVERIPEEYWLNMMMDGHAKGTNMSVHNLVAYLIGWGELLLKWIEQAELGAKVDFPETGYQWNELGLLAQKFYKDYEQLSFAVCLIRLEETVEKILTLIESKNNQELYEIPWYGKYPMGRMIQLNTASPFKNARGRLRKVFDFK